VVGGWSMASAKALLNIRALSRSSSPAQTLPSEAVLDALKMMLIGAAPNEVLTSVTRLIDAHSEGMLCSLFLLDEDGLHLRYGGVANLPEAYRAATDGVCIGPNVGSCGTAAAAYRARKQVSLGLRPAVVLNGALAAKSCSTGRFRTLMYRKRRARTFKTTVLTASFLSSTKLLLKQPPTFRRPPR
jgi:hypothetical protein